MDFKHVQLEAKNAVLFELHRATGSPVSRAELEKSTGVCDRKVRIAIADLRADETPIATLDHGGYRLVSSPEDLNTTIRKLLSRCQSMAIVIGGLRKAQRRLDGKQPTGQIKLI